MVQTAQRDGNGTTGKSAPIVSSPRIKNISLYRNSDLRYQYRRPVPTEGRFAIVTVCRVRDAMAVGGFRRKA
jgi:hypothetical protein